MKVEDFKALSAKLLAWADKRKVEHLWQQFLTALQQTLKGNRQQPVTQQKDQLFGALRSFDQVTLTYSERNLFDILSYEQNVGSSAVAGLDDILHDERFDPAGVLQRIESKHNDFKQFIQTSRTLTAAMERIPSLGKTSLREGESLLEITFADEAAVDNIVEFESWIDRWSKIIRAFSQLVGEKPESSRIVFVQKSSPMVMDVATACGLVLVLGQAVDAVLSRVEKYLKIRAQVEEIRKLKLENKQIERDLAAEADAFSKKASHEIATELAQKVAAKGKRKAKPDGEDINGVSLAINNLFVFIDNGGRVDCPGDADAGSPDLADVFKEVRKLQQSVDRLHLLPAPAEGEGRPDES